MADKENETNEIDLIVVFQLIGKGIKNSFWRIVKSVIFLTTFFIKNLHWIAIAIAVGCFAGFLFYINTPKYYSSEMVVKPNGILSSEVIQYISDLNKLTRKSNINNLASAMKVDNSVAAGIKSLEAVPFLDINKDGIGDIIDRNNNFNPLDTAFIIANDKVFVEIEVYHNSDFNSIKQGVTNYFNANDYFNTMFKLHHKNLEELILFTNNEIAKLDSLQDVEYFSNDLDKKYETKSQFMVLTEKKKQMYHKEKAALINKRQRYQKDLALATAPIAPIKNFTALASEENQKEVYIIWFGVLFGLIGYFGLIIFKNRTYLNNIISEI